MTGRRIAVLAAALVLSAIALARVALTMAVYGPTADESAHIAGGYNWYHGLRGSDMANPPLPRILFALPLRDAPEPAERDWYKRGESLLEEGDYLANLRNVRLGNLVFLAALLAIVFVWTDERFGDVAALIALALVSTLPPILGHAALATHDVAIAAALPIAMYAAVRWLDRATWPRTIALGVALGAGVLTKYSFAPYFAVAVVILLLLRRSVPPLGRAAVAVLVAGVVIWTLFRFDVDSLAGCDRRGMEMARLSNLEWVANVPVPAPLFFAGLLDVVLHNENGHLAYLLGHWSRTGWRSYFPLILLFKTPLPFLILAMAGTALLLRRREWRLALLPLAVLLPAMMSDLDLGVRYILPLYPLLAMTAGYAAVTIRPRLVVALLLAWQLVGTTLAHPNYLGWFNELAGGHPERVALDSNLDWGQDALPLARACRALGIRRVGVAINSGASLDRLGMPPHYELGPYDDAHGWVAVSAGILVRTQHDRPRAFAALRKARRIVPVGSSIKLYELP